MSIGSLYHYIGAKDDILYLVFDYALSRETEFIENASTTHSALSPTEALREAIKAYYGIVDDIQDMVVFMYQETKSLRSSAREHVFEQERRIIAVFEAILARGCESGEFKIKDIATVSNDIVIMGDAWAFRRWLLKRHYTIQEFTRQQTTFILEGILGEDRYP